jgi:hemoglobin
MTTASLYERLGGRPGIQKVVEETIRLHLDNPRIATRFRKMDVAKVTQHVCEFFCMGAGGPEAYTGRGLLDAHAGMNIDEEELISAIDDIVTAMRKHGAQQPEINEVVGILYSLKGEVVRV